MQVKRTDDGASYKNTQNTQSNEPLSLATLTDQQKRILSDISYIDLTLAGKMKLYEGGGIKFSELDKYLATPNGNSSGNIIPGIQYESISESIMGDILDSDKTLCQNAVAAGLGDLVLTDITMDPQTGFCGFTFKDEAGNTGISYRGSDFDYENGSIQDWIGANLGGHLMGDSKQGYQASLYFLQQCDRSGNNYTYGYSLGGNLVQQCFRDNHELIAEAFSINGNPISPKMINTPEIQAAFNSDKFNCCIIAGDLVALTKKTDAYKSNIRIIENVDGVTTSFMAAHGLKQASYDENGNFKTMDYEETIQQMKAEYEKSGPVAFGKNGWEILSLIQEADSWLTDKTHQPPSELKEAVIRKLTEENKIPVVVTEKNEPKTVLGVLADAWTWTKDSVSTLFKPVTNVASGTANLAISTIGEIFVCPEKVSDNLSLWWKDVTDIDMGDWAADMAHQVGLAPQRLDGSRIDNMQDLEKWRKEILEEMGDKSPAWLKEDTINFKIAQTIIEEEKGRIVRGESHISAQEFQEDPNIVLDELFGENNKYSKSMSDILELTGICKNDQSKLESFVNQQEQEYAQNHAAQTAENISPELLDRAAEVISAACMAEQDRDR